MTRRSIFAIASLLCIGLLMVLPIDAVGQAVYGSILGTVTDANGAAVPNATVTVTNVGQGTTIKTTTNESGNYSVEHLIAGTYNVRVEAPSFKTTETKATNVSVDAATRVDAKLEVGAVSQTVDVTAEPDLLKTDKADISITFNEKAISELPLFNRNFTTLELSAPGTQKLVGWGHAATEDPQGGQQIFVNGQHFSGTAFELDGTDNQDPILGIIVINPTLESVSEAKITTQNYDAQFGKAIAGVVTSQTKSGSNSLHGSGFFFRRSDATQARNPFTESVKNPITHRFVAPSLWKQYGGSIGGPIIRDRLFIFGDYQGTRRASGRTVGPLSVPSNLVRTTCLAPTGNCDLSEYLAGGQGQIYDPGTGAADGTGRTPFAGNLIPVGRLSTQAVALLKALPAATAAGITNNFTGSGSGPYNDDTFNVRVDHAATQKLHIFGRYSMADFRLSGKGVFGALGGEGFGENGLAGSAKSRDHSIASGFDYALSPTLLTDFRFGYFRYKVASNKFDVGTAPATAFGIPGLNTGNSATSGLPGFFIQGGNQPDLNFGEALNITRCNCPLTENEHQYQFVNNWTKIVGNHSIKFGGDIRFASNLRVPSDANRTGQLFFNRLGTSNGGTGGVGIATFLLGDVTRLERYVSSSLNAAERQKRWFFYGQDLWRITPKLTVNYGTRYELYFPETVNGKGNGGFADLATGTIRVAGYGGFGLNGNIKNTFTNFAPRVGVAYQATPKTVLRAGYGRSFDIGVFGSIFGHSVTQNLPVLVNQVLQGTSIPGGTNDRTTVFTLTSGPPAFVFDPIPANGLIPFANTASPKIRPTKMRLPTVDAWNATIERQITASTTVEVAYVGNKGTHTFAGNGPSYNVNQPTVVGYNPVLTDPSGRIIFDAAGNPTFLPACAPGVTGFNPGCNVPQSNRRPFNRGGTPAFNNGGVTCCNGDLGNYLGNNAGNNYNSLQTKFTSRFSKGLQFSAHYTWSRAMNYDGDYFGVWPFAVYGPDDFNRRHVLSANAIYALPFGRGQMFGSDVNRFVDAIFGGWQLTTISNWSSGLPFSARYNNCGQDTDTGPCRPDRVRGSFPLSVGKLDPVGHFRTFFIPLATPLANRGDVSGAFRRPFVDQFGGSRNSFYGPRSFTSNLSLMKTFSLGERVKAQFRAEGYNIFNHPVMGFSSTQGNTCIDCAGSDAGKITNIEQGTAMRNFQFGIRVSF